MSWVGGCRPIAAAVTPGSVHHCRHAFKGHRPAAPSLPQDLLNCVLLAEHVYKIVDHSLDASLAQLNATRAAAFPPQLVTLRAVQWAQPHVRHRFLLGESEGALYVAFMGTKLPRDMATNLTLFEVRRRRGVGRGEGGQGSGCAPLGGWRCR